MREGRVHLGSTGLGLARFLSPLQVDTMKSKQLPRCLPYASWCHGERKEEEKKA